MSNEEQQQSQTAKGRPAKTFRLGLLSLSVWKNGSDPKKQFLTYSLRRAWLNDEKWEYSSNFRTEDLANIKELLKLALAWATWQGKLQDPEDD